MTFLFGEVQVQRQRLFALHPDGSRDIDRTVARTSELNVREIITHRH